MTWRELQENWAGPHPTPLQTAKDFLAAVEAGDVLYFRIEALDGIGFIDCTSHGCDADGHDNLVYEFLEAKRKKWAPKVFEHG